MKTLSLATVALGVVALVSSAAAADPTGAWKSALTLNGQTLESTLRLYFDSEGRVLSGHVDDSFGRRQPLPLTQTTLKGARIHFVVQHVIDGESVSVNYNGTVTSDAITGKATFEYGDRSQLAEWLARRQK